MDVLPKRMYANGPAPAYGGNVLYREIRTVSARILYYRTAALTLACALAGAGPALAQLDLGAEEIVQAGGAAIDVPGYSVPSFVHWDGDGLRDLVVGEGSGTYTPKVRVYLNAGTSGSPLFSTYFFAQSGGET
jgi:hypothetical protein